MARALSDILTELNSTYQPQKDVYTQEINSLDPSQDAELKGLDAAKQDAFSDINTDANRKGLYYSGVPIDEQAKYTGATYLPSVANLKSKYAQQRFNLQDALAGLSKDQYNRATDVYEGELDRDAQLEASKAASASTFNPTLGGSPQVLGASTGGYGFKQRTDGGFNFVDQFGNPISAATYAAATGTPFRTLLQSLANKGDKGATSALGFVGDDYKYNPNKIGNNGSLYNALTWGTGNNYKSPANAFTSAAGSTGALGGATF